MERADVSGMAWEVTTDKPCLLYLITEDWYFWSHRLDLARAARTSGFDVAIATRVTDHGELIRQEGFRLFPISMDRRSRNPFRECTAALELIRLYRRERPQIVHHVALKPILYGSLAARIVRVPVVINAFAGLGYAFTDRDRSRSRWQPCMRWALTFAVRGNDSTVLCQNADDRDRLCVEGIVRADHTRIVAGSGVDTERFRPVGHPQGVPIVLLPGRMLWDKGIQEFVDAARSLRSEGLSARFILVGRCDEDNPAAITSSQIESWVREGIVEWWGHREDMSEVYAQASFVVLPSYREGLPKVLLEAGACGKALIATNVPGCREVVRHRVNGLLVRPRHAAELAEAIKTMLVDAPERERMGKAARELIVREFAVSHITDQMVSLYRDLLKSRGCDSSFQGQR